jgi:hypothetical protein
MANITPISKAFSQIPTGSNRFAVGRPTGLASCPAFVLNTKRSKYDVQFKDETQTRKNEINAIENQSLGIDKIFTVGNDPMINFINSKGYNSPQKPFHQWSNQDVIDFGNVLPNHEFMIMDFEPDLGIYPWMIDYGIAATNSNMVTLCNHLLASRNIKACDSVHRPFEEWYFSDTPSVKLTMNTDGFKQENAGGVSSNSDAIIDAYNRVYNPSDLAMVVKNNPFTFNAFDLGYKNPFYNKRDSENQNTAHTAVPLAALAVLDAFERYKKLYPGKPMIAFCFAYAEYFNQVKSQSEQLDVTGDGIADIKNKGQKLIYPLNVYEDLVTMSLVAGAAQVLYWQSNPEFENETTHALNWTQENPTNIWGVYQTLTGNAVADPAGNATYFGRDGFLISAMISGMQQYSTIQHIVENATIQSVVVRYNRPDRNGTPTTQQTTTAYTDGRWYNRAARFGQMYALVAKHNVTGAKVVLAQDWFAHAGIGTTYEFDFEGITYNNDNNGIGLKTKGNRLTIATI